MPVARCTFHTLHSPLHTSHLSSHTSDLTAHSTFHTLHFNLESPSRMAESCVSFTAGLHLANLSIFILVALVRYWEAQNINTQIPIFRVVHHVCTASSYYCRATHMLSHTYQFELTPRLILRSPPKSQNYLHATRFLRFQSL